jgi:ElaB/YqjD/DUF883 family membrane-anchored ribosome-binding protein
MGITDDLKTQGQNLSKTVDGLLDKAKDKLHDGLPDNVKDKAEHLIDKAVDALPDNLTEKIEELADKAKGLLGGIGGKAKDAAEAASTHASVVSDAAAKIDTEDKPGA